MWSFWCSWENWGFCWQLSLLVICVPMYQMKQLKIKSNLQNMCLPLIDYTLRCFKGMGKIWSQICKWRFQFFNSWELASINWKWGSEYYALSFRTWARALKTWAHRGCHLADNRDWTRIQNWKHETPVRAPEQTERTMTGNKHGSYINGEQTQPETLTLGARAELAAENSNNTPSPLNSNLWHKELYFLWTNLAMPAIQWVTGKLERGEARQRH